jgi:hypothetical protein
MGINEAVAAIEKFLLTYDGGSGPPVGAQVRPSGDVIDEIKIWVDLGPARRVDIEAYERACAAAIREGVPGASAFKLDVRAEADRLSQP